MEHIDPDVIAMMGGATLGIVMLFVYCFFGQFVSDNCLKFNDHICEVRWYQFPLPIQKLIIVVSANAQENLAFESLNVVKLSLDFFAKVKNKNFLK